MPGAACASMARTTLPPISGMWRSLMIASAVSQTTTSIASLGLVVAVTR